MRFHLSLLFVYLLVCDISAQTNRFIYNLSRQAGGATRDFKMVLDVNPDEVKFYDYRFIEIDSANKKNPDKEIRTTSFSQQVLKRKRNSHQHISYFANSDLNYFSIASDDPIEWKLSDELREVDGYTLQKASADFRGRHWVAWFSPDVPISEGPYKFCGLPGLIFEVEDSEKHYVYKLVSNTQLRETADTSNFLETFYGDNPIAINWKKYEKLMLDEYNDPFNRLAKSLREGKSIRIGSEEITSTSQLDARRRSYQETIKKYYNPIERDKLINYPSK